MVDAPKSLGSSGYALALESRLARTLPRSFSLLRLKPFSVQSTSFKFDEAGGVKPLFWDYFQLRLSK